MHLASHTPRAGTAVNVMIVDDSTIVRGMLFKKISEIPGVAVSASLANGHMAVQHMKTHPVDIVVLDIEMPVKDGLTALPEMLALSPHTKIIMASELTPGTAELNLRALEMGAADYIPKPGLDQSKEALEIFYRDLVAKVRALATAITRRAAPRAAPVPPSGKPSAALAPWPAKPEYPASAPKAIAIAASTGGPQALLALFKEWRPAASSAPVFITQHMPATFTAILAHHIKSVSGRDCREGQDGERVENGRVYLAPGDRHMVPVQRGGGVHIALSQGPEVHFCRPAADPMIAALTEIYGKELLLLVLTGMGQDGLDGARKLAAKGGFIAVQDDASSVVWGMPGAIAQAGLAKAVLPLAEIPAYLRQTTGGAP